MSSDSKWASPVTLKASMRHSTCGSQCLPRHNSTYFLCTPSLDLVLSAEELLSFGVARATPRMQLLCSAHAVEFPSIVRPNCHQDLPVDAMSPKETIAATRQLIDKLYVGS